MDGNTPCGREQLAAKGFRVSFCQVQAGSEMELRQVCRFAVGQGPWRTCMRNSIVDSHGKPRLSIGVETPWGGALPGAVGPSGLQYLLTSWPGLCEFKQALTYVRDSGASMLSTTELPQLQRTS